MPYCTKCGALTDSSSGLCSSCSISSHGIGTPDDVPCQRCGMYLPPHELRMWNSRLYCSYCIMDIQDAEQLGRREKRPEPEGEGGKNPSGEGAPQGGSSAPGTCERCGRQADALYVRSGQRLCIQCSQSGGEAGTGRASPFGQLVMKVKKALGISPRLVAKNPQASGRQEAEQPDPQVFSIKDRQMEERKPEIAEQKLMGEEPKEKKKPAPKAKKFFFDMHPEEKGSGKK